MKTQSKILLSSVIRLLVQAMEILNRIDEKDYQEIVLKAQKHEKNIKGVRDNSGRGNIFMVIFFVRELVESVLNDK